jgi:hypothetical protein
VPRNEPIVKVEHIEHLDKQQVLDDLKQRRGKGNLKKLADHAKQRGYEPSDSPDAVLGYRHRFEAAEERAAPRGAAGAPVKETELELVLQNFKKAGSRDQAAVGVAVIRSGPNVEEYNILLEAPEGNLNAYSEFTVENGNIVETESWWSALVSCFTGTCGPICATALATCTGSWIEYIGCVLWRCGGCGVKCAGCATCNCSWWCSWATGCCRQ